MQNQMNKHIEVWTCLNSFKRLKYKRILMALITAYTIFIYFCGTSLKIDQKQYAETKAYEQHTRQKKGLLITTYYRSGSTFLGQFFNQRRNAFYIFEPLVAFGDSCSRENETSPKIEHLHNLFHCRFSDQTKVLKMATSPENYDPDSNAHKNCVRNNFCFREKSKMLCSTAFCKTGNHYTCSRCEPVDLRMAEQLCINAEIVVIKVIRLCFLKNLQSLLQDPTLDLKVLHLVRDPRGTVSSREQLHQNDVTKIIHNDCKRVVANFEYMVSATANSIESKHKLIRYEDICMKPIEYAEKIYQFVGLAMTDRMKRWIFSNTQGDLSYLKESRAVSLIIQSKKKRARAEKRILSIESIKNAVLNDPYTTTRMSKTNWRKWAVHLTFQKMVATQNACLDMMKAIGYIEVKNKTLMNSTTLLTKFCPINQNVAFC